MMPTLLQAISPLRDIGQLTPRALRARRLLIQHTCQAVTELTRPGRVEQLVDADLQRCTWCGAWTHQGPSCRRCAATHPTNGATT